MVRGVGTLTRYLQQEFARLCPADWQSRSEVSLLAPDLSRLLGYAPRADVLLEHQMDGRRIWIEFEVSRADPVANHAKFATSHLFQPQPPADTFVSMISPHVTRGRRNLASNTVTLMRQVGMRAFQTVLFPHLSGDAVARLNHTDFEALAPAGRPAAEPELERVLAVTEPIAALQTHRIHFAADILDVLLNVREWNAAIETEEGARAWGRRTVTFFVCDPQSKQFAPAKFCAFLPLKILSGNTTEFAGQTRATMTLNLYTSLGGTDTRFDGHRARDHLTRRLAMAPVGVESVRSAFHAWMAQREHVIQLHPSGAQILVPPAWFR